MCIRDRSFNMKGAAGGLHPEADQWGERTHVQHDAVTDKAKEWANHRYGLQALRPMIEIICVWQVPYPDWEKPYESIVRTGAGALNIKGDGAWIETGAGYRRENKTGQN